MRHRWHTGLFAAAVAVCGVARGEAAASAEPAASVPIVHHKAKHAAPGSPFAVGPFVVETRTMRYVPSSTDDPNDHPAQAWARGSIVMPFVVGGPPGVAARVNEALYLHAIRNAAPTEPGPTFTPPHEAAANGLEYDGVNFSVLRGGARGHRRRRRHRASRRRGTAACRGPVRADHRRTTRRLQRLPRALGTARRAVRPPVGCRTDTRDAGARPAPVPGAEAGRAHATALALDEDKDKGFALRIDGRRLTGTWHGGGKTLPVTLE